jgi:dienelactone hydrolase
MTISPLPQPDDKELAALAAAVYDSDAQQVGSWTRVFDPVLKLIPAGIGPTSKPDPTSGFKAAVFQDQTGERHVLAFAGSERETRDWLTNLAQGLGMDTAQYRQACAFAQECKVGFGDSLTLTGHSLGGGLAAAASAATNTPAVTFNPSGVHRKTLERVGIDAEKFREVAAETGFVRKYVVKGEILDRVQGFLPVPEAPGAQITVEVPERRSWMAKHGMDSVMAAMDHSANRVEIAESKLGPVNASAKELALTFRNKEMRDGVKEQPILESAYRMLGRIEQYAAGLQKDAGTKLIAATRENLAKRLERGETIPMPRQDRVAATDAGIGR